MVACWHLFTAQGTPFVAKSYDSTKVIVGSVSKGTVGRTVQFTVDAGDAGEGNLGKNYFIQKIMTFLCANVNFSTHSF